jgi:hypothetical protein
VDTVGEEYGVFAVSIEELVDRFGDSLNGVLLAGVL